VAKVTICTTGAGGVVLVAAVVVLAGAVEVVVAGAEVLVAPVVVGSSEASSPQAGSRSSKVQNRGIHRLMALLRWDGTRRPLLPARR
jgi:hypothetical protein